MKNDKKNKSVESGDRFKLQVDYRTIIVVKSKAALQMWMSKYPAAKLIA